MLIEECYILAKFGKQGSFQDMQRLPTYVRRFMLHKLNEEVTNQKDANEKAQRKANSKKTKL